MLFNVASFFVTGYLCHRLGADARQAVYAFCAWLGGNIALGYLGVIS